MQTSRQTAGETAIRTMVIFRDCHAKNNILVPILTADDERFFSNLAAANGWLHTMRRPETEKVAQSSQTTGWRKPSALLNRTRPKLIKAFELRLTPLAKEGGVK